MIITWYGQSCFKIETQGITIAIDPFGKELGLAPPRFKADVLFITHEHGDHNYREAFTPLEAQTRQSRTQKPDSPNGFAPRYTTASTQLLTGFKDALTIDGPGEYDLMGIAAKGIGSFHDSNQGKERGVNTIYAIESEDIRLAHLGDIGQLELTSEQLEALGAIDILMIPTGGTFTVDGETAAEITTRIEPKIVIPMHYALPRMSVELEPVERFLKEIGQKPTAQPKLTVKKKDLGEDGTKAVVLTPPSLTN